MFTLPSRWDKGPYLPNAAAGAASWAACTLLQYSTAAGAPEREVALHIQKAFTTPGTTQLPMAQKDVQGKSPDPALPSPAALTFAEGSCTRCYRSPRDFAGQRVMPSCPFRRLPGVATGR